MVRPVVIGVGSVVAASSRMQAFFKECDVHDLLDAVTVIYDYLYRNDDYLSKKSADDYNPYEAWRNEVDRIFREEHLAYRLDDDAVVRPGIDTTAARRRLLSRCPDGFEKRSLAGTDRDRRPEQYTNSRL